MFKKICWLVILQLSLLMCQVSAEDIGTAIDYQVIGSQSLIDKAIEAVKYQSGNNAADVVIASMGNVQDMVLPIGNVELNAQLPYGIKFSTPTVVNITASVDQRIIKKVKIMLDVKFYQQVVVANRQISFNEILAPEDLRYERLNVGRFTDSYFTDINKVVGLSVRRSVTPGMMLTDAMVKKPIIVKRGDVINIIAKVGCLEIKTIGQAMQDGYEGQLIRVQNIASQKIISAKILSDTSAQVLTY